MPSFVRGVCCAAAAVGVVVSMGCSSTPPPRSVEPARADVLPQLPTSSTPRPEGTASDQTTSVRISEELASACGIAQPDAFFAFDSFNLDSSDRSPLSLVAKCFTSGPMKGRSLKLIGHADPRGETEYNMVLGQSRADSVAGFLEGKGLVKDHISTTSRGAMDAKGTDENTWAHDRRVDVMLGT